jgi:uncharacterized membrane protein HdeD (DUF308 family)
MNFPDVKYRLMNNWHTMRIVRLALAVFFLIDAWKASDLLIALFGGLLLFQGIWNVGCCGAGSCEVRGPKETNELAEGQK